eukprot:TRINITY_DN21608_c0_g1_i2.p1 TRINITY_DN21608_c0_g1~~TRINITY_DN21608_c0_g1_i2.p1  ORF type:complete len:178 (+),score=38.44 TRINITY_DN21608_c0_g1_i2:85-618(+)
MAMVKASSAIAIREVQEQVQAEVELGEMHIKKRMAAVKGRLREGNMKLDGSMRNSRELVLASAGLSGSQGGFDLTFNSLDSKRRMQIADAKTNQIQGTNALDKYMNAEKITRAKEELNYDIPTLRQVLRVDDTIALTQMTKSQLCALPSDPSMGKDKTQKRDPRAKLRHMQSYRMGI